LERYWRWLAWRLYFCYKKYGYEKNEPTLKSEIADFGLIKAVGDNSFWQSNNSQQADEIEILLFSFAYYFYPEWPTIPPNRVLASLPAGLWSIF
jgi:hypothetical protein